MSRLKTFIEPTKKNTIICSQSKNVCIFAMSKHYNGGDDTRQNTLTGFFISWS